VVIVGSGRAVVSHHPPSEVDPIGNAAESSQEPTESSGLLPAGHLIQLSQDLCQSLSTPRIGFTLEFIVTFLPGILEVRRPNLIDLLPKFHDSFADIIRMNHGISKEEVLIVV
jgi:hypothetical protein